MSMSTRQKRIDDLIFRLRERGNRLTPQRLAVLQTVIGNHEHLSVDVIYERVRADYPMIGLATVYKTIAMLKEMGEITEININSDCARYDGSGDDPHPHFVCMQCNSILDIEDNILGQLPQNLAQKKGYQITHYRLDFFGICPNCQSG